MDLACQCQISSDPTAIISALIIAKELPLPSGPRNEAILRISWSPEESHADDEVPRKLDTFCLYPSSALRRRYWEFLHDSGRCGVLYHERPKCYTRIVNCWLLFLEVTPDPERPNSLVHEEWRKLVLANWSRCLSKCVPGNKDLICRLRDFTLDQACKEDVEHVISWLKVSLQR